MKSYYLLFDDSKTAISFYAELKKVGLKCTMSPTPRKASHCCGVSILYYNCKDKTIIENICKKLQFKVSRFWECENEDDPNRGKFC